MTYPNGPVIIRQSSAPPLLKPGVHAYNRRRRFHIVRERISKLSILQLCLVALGLAGIGYYTYTLVDEHVYQSFQNWAFDQGIAGRSNVTFADYLSERTLFGFLTRGREPAATQSPVGAKTPDTSQTSAPPAPVRPAAGAVLGRLEISRLHLSAIVREGVSDKVLRVAVGHVPATALAGQPGNFAIAAHRDTLFRALKDIRNDDLVTFQSPDGSAYQYRVAATQIVKPSDVTVLRSDGGRLITDSGSTGEMPKLLTMITCYPFSYVGSAPKRFIVEAKLVENEEAPKLVPTAAPSPETEIAVPVHKTPAHTVTHRRGTWPRSERTVARHIKAPLKSAAVPVRPVKKKGFWRKLFGNG